MLKKYLVLLGIVLLIGFVVSQLFLVPIAEATIESRIKSAAHAEKVEVEASAVPSVMLLFGEFGDINIKVKNAMLGDVRVSELSLDGKNVSLPMRMPDGFEINKADKLELTGIFSDEDLQYLIGKKVERLENIKVEIKPDIVKASGILKIAGRKAEINIEGKLLTDMNSIYFRMSSFHVRNSLLGSLAGSLFGDIELLDFNRLKLPVQLDEVIQENGFARVVASKHN